MGSVVLLLLTAICASDASAAVTLRASRRLSEAVSSDGAVPSLRWLPNMDLERDTGPDDGARISDGTIIPVFPIQNVLFMPYNTPNLTMLHLRHRKMYEEISFTGARQFAVVYQNSDGYMLDVGCVFYLTDVLTNKNRTVYVGEHTVTGRVQIKRILNPSDFVPPELDQEAQHGRGYSAPDYTPVQGEAETAVRDKKNYLLAQAAPLLDTDPIDEEHEAKAGTELAEILLAIAQAQEKLGDVPRVEFAIPPAEDAGKKAQGSKETLNFGRGTGGVWGTANSSWTFADMGLWGAIGLWQSFLAHRYVCCRRLKCAHEPNLDAAF